MKWESLENKIKTALFGHKSEVDVDALWSAIESDVDVLNRKKKRRGLIWFWLAGIVLVGSAGGYFYQKTIVNRHSQSPQTVAVVAQEMEPITHHDAMVESENNSVIKIGEPKPATASLGQEKLEDKKLENKLKPGGKLGASTGKNAKTFEKANGFSKNNKQAVLAQNPKIIASNKEDIAPISTSIFPGNLKLNKQGELVQLATILPTLPLSFFEIEKSRPVLKEMGFPLTEKTPILRQRDFSFAVNLQGSLSFVQRNLALKDSLGLDLLPLRNRTERELEAYQFGLGFTLQHRSGFNLSTGLNYTQINEQFRFSEAVTTLDSVFDIKYLVINLNDDTTAIYGNVLHEVKTTFQKEYYNKYRMFDVPILVGYRHEGHDFSVGVQAGVFFNLNLSTQGQILKSADETTSIDTAGIFKSNISMSYYLGLYAGYHINENLEVYVSPFVRHFPKDFTEKRYALRQQYNLYGVNIGLRYKF